MMRNTLTRPRVQRFDNQQRRPQANEVNCVCFTNLSRKRRSPLMKFYCGIDLSARDCQVCVIDGQLKLLVQQKLRNDLPQVCRLLRPYQANLQIVVESTFNWYW